MLENFKSQNGPILKLNYGYNDRLIQWIPNRYKSQAFDFNNNLANFIRLMYKKLPDRVASKIEEGSVRKSEISSIYIHLSSFEDMLN